MHTAVIGAGHVGLVTAACLAHWGRTVAATDVDRERIAGLRAGRMPFHEPGLADLVRDGVAANRLTFVDDLADAIDGADVAFVCVGTPPLPGGAPNLAYVEAVGRAVAAHAARDLLLVEKSTVPANTGERLARAIAHEQARHGTTGRIEVASNPEFLREGQAVQDTLEPDRLVVGVQSEWAGRLLREVYRPVVERHGTPFVVTDLTTAELIKHASNAFLATRISFINAVAQICERVGADVEQVARGMGFDRRIGTSFLSAGLGYGGSCFPKDVDAFIHLSRSVGYEFGILEAVRDVNTQMREHVLDRLRAELWHLEGKTITLLGAAFKPGTDDLREAPATWLAERLLAEGAIVRVYDPVALSQVKEALPDVLCVTDPMLAVEDAHAAVVCTEWPEVVALSPDDLARALAYPVVVDGRNVFEPEAMRMAGIRHHAVGRPRAGVLA